MVIRYVLIFNLCISNMGIIPSKEGAQSFDEGEPKTRAAKPDTETRPIP